MSHYNVLQSKLVMKWHGITAQQMLLVFFPKFLLQNIEFFIARTFSVEFLEFLVNSWKINFRETNKKL